MQAKGITVVRVVHSHDNRWHVLENDFEDPLAAFDDRQSACDYANRFSAAQDSSTVILLDESEAFQGKEKEPVGDFGKRHPAVTGIHVPK